MVTLKTVMEMRSMKNFGAKSKILLDQWLITHNYNVKYMKI